MNCRRLGPLVGEFIERATEVQERTVIGPRGLDYESDTDHVIPRNYPVVMFTRECRDGPLDQRNIERARPHGHSLKTISTPLGELHSNFTHVLAQHAYPKPCALAKSTVGAAISADAEQHERRIQGNGRERSSRETGALARGRARGYHRDPSRETGERLTKIRRIHRDHAEAGMPARSEARATSSRQSLLSYPR